MGQDRFTAYIDESGCSGFQFDAGSTKWFILSALVVRKKNEGFVYSKISTLKQELCFQRLQAFHFHKQGHDARVKVLEALNEWPVKVVTVAFCKTELSSEFKEVREQMFNYAGRLLIERISWLCFNDSPTHKVDLVFSQRKQMSHAEVVAYVERLKTEKTSIRWEAICSSRLSVESTKRSSMLQMADATASAFLFSISPPKGDPYPYAQLLKRVYYKHNFKRKQYGIKLLPDPDKLEGAGFPLENLPLEIV